MKNANGWFEVDKKGLAKLVERKGKAFVLYELLQNAWDCNKATEVAVTLEPMPRSKTMARLTVTDDHPNGFSNLAHSYTLFAESEKKSNPQRRGRFNLGEKLVLALCDEARISSTKGTVIFDAKGRTMSAYKRPSGTQFSASVRMSREEVAYVCAEAVKVISPMHVLTTINGVELLHRKPAKVINAFLQTEVAGASGVLQRKFQDTPVELYVPRQGERATLYEMGIPVMVLSDDLYHVNVMQKVPLSMERDAVTPAYLRDVRGAILDQMHDFLSPTDVRGKWVSDALEEACNKDAIRAVVHKRYGDKVVIQDPSDREANNIATAKGYTVIPGGAFTAEAWEQIKASDAAKPAGQVTPSPKPFHPDGTPLETVPYDEWTRPMEVFARLTSRLALELEDIHLTVVFTKNKTWKFNAAYSKGLPTGISTGTMTVNAGLLGSDFFLRANLSEQLQLFTHELGHHFGHHLEESYHEALCRIGSKLAVHALNHPHDFE